MKIGCAQNGAAIGGLPKDELVQSAEVRCKAFPHPLGDVFSGGIVDQIVERLMIQQVDDFASDHLLDHVEILDHPASRTFRLERTAHGNLQPVRMAVHAAALTGMVRKYVSRLESEVLANLHGETV